MSIRPALLVLAVAALLGLATAFVSPLKTVTAVQCPWSLKEFGGQETYSELLSPRPPTDKPGRCWPGGHAATDPRGRAESVALVGRDHADAAARWHLRPIDFG